MKIFHDKRIVNIFKVLLSLAAIIFVVVRLLEFDNWSTFYDFLSANRAYFFVLLLLQLFLSSLNILLEALKWRQLLSTTVSQNLMASIFQVLKGLQFGMITPARAGDPLARSLLLPKGLRMQAFLLSVSGSLIQNMVLVLGAFFGFLFLRSNAIDSQVLAELQSSLFLSFLFILFVVLFLPLMAYLSIKISGKKVWKIRFYRYILLIKQLGRLKAFKILSLTILRYFVFCAQLFFILYYFEIIVNLGEFWLIPVYFAVLTFIPSFAIADLGIRGSLALFFFGALSDSYPAIIISVFLLWCLNLALPALIGVFIKPTNYHNKSKLKKRKKEINI